MAKKKKKLKGLYAAKYFIGGLISGIKGARQSKQDIAAAEADRITQLAKEEELRNSRQKLTMSPEIAKMKEGLGGTEINRRQEAAERTRAGAMAAATRGGSRVDPFAAAKAGSQQESALATEQAQSQRAGLKAGVAERGKLRDTQENREKADYARQAQQADYAREDVMAGQANLASYQQQQYGAIDAGIGTVASMSDRKTKKNIKKVGKSKDGVPISEFNYKDKKNAPKGPGRYRGVIAQDLIGTEHEDAVKKIGQNTLGVKYGKLDVSLGKLKVGKLKDKIKNRKYNKGGNIKKGYHEMPNGDLMKNSEMPKKEQMEAGEAEVTPGKFSHEKNPIDLVQKNGEKGKPEKIGEMTGGEAIVPPKNVKQMRKMINSNDGDALVSLMDKLLTKWDREAQDSPESEEEFSKTMKSKHGSVLKPRMPSGKQKFKLRNLGRATIGKI